MHSILLMVYKERIVVSEHVFSVDLQVLQETDIIAEGRIKARAAPAAPKKAEGGAKDESTEAPGDTVAPAAEATEAAPAPAAEAPKAEPAPAAGLSCCAALSLLAPRSLSSSEADQAFCYYSA